MADTRDYYESSDWSLPIGSAREPHLRHCSGAASSLQLVDFRPNVVGNWKRALRLVIEHDNDGITLGDDDLLRGTIGVMRHFHAGPADGGNAGRDQHRIGMGELPAEVALDRRQDHAGAVAIHQFS